MLIVHFYAGLCSAIGLPREVPPGGLTVAGRYYKQGSILSVPSFTIHRDPDVWGPDADTYRLVAIAIFHDSCPCVPVLSYRQT